MAIEIPNLSDPFDELTVEEYDGDKDSDTTEVSYETDPMKIQVEIPDQKTPIVVLFGPPASGKTMMLIRLSRWLRRNGYSVVPNRLFRPNDPFYTRMCDEFNSMIDSPEAAEGTNIVSFMLATVSKNRQPICQILEAPGEHFHNSKRITNEFPPYLNRIISSSKNRKVYLVLAESDVKLMGDGSSRDQYVEKIRTLRKKAVLRDKFIVVLNKVDLSSSVQSGGVYDARIAKKEVREAYPGIFEIFKNTHPITSFFKPSHASFIAFQSGTFSESSDGNTVIYEESNDIYASRLWKMILEKCR
ncbi:MAG: hypothetical protein PUJ69_02205 [Porphyromonas somerae]|uniref:hypothetical protein n=1 Tax=Porphyromonas somerae TaxID=322095 RepID=UPI0026EB3FEB|nr:hypothetical protein [Porphyromonas somerae]MDD7557469.1 hypothetical protein [Porphyromonas somerae]MDY5815967.1 hypothetical protein [Porphyromonas somerae]